MKYDDFAFVNQQLAGMLRAGIPLEGALRQLCKAMQRGRLRGEFEKLEVDLSQGVALNQALASRKLPSFYIQMIQVGVKSNDLPSVLILLADYYQRVGFLWTRLKGLMTYPFIVLLAALALSLLVVGIYQSLGPIGALPWVEVQKLSSPSVGLAGLLLPPMLLGCLALVFIISLTFPKLRVRMCWFLPGFKEAHLSRFASSLNLMLKSGCDLKSALGLLRQMEKGTPMDSQLSQWEESIAQGHPKFPSFGAGGIVPPLFVWVISAEGEDWESGLTRAAEIYYARAVYQTEVLLNAAMPVSILLLGAMIVTQLLSLVHLMTGGTGPTGFFQSLGGF